MQDAETAAQRRAAPMAALRAKAGADGWLRPLGRDHHALFRPGGETLLVTFETTASFLRGRDGHWSDPLHVGAGWSVLTILSHRRTWFRDRAVYAFFDELTDDDFFDDFERALFYGAGVQGYAAAAYSVSAPGSTVVLAAPLATLDPGETPWERRFRSDRALRFGPRYGYAPDMLDAARKVWLVTDPTEHADAMHASLFRAPHVVRLPAPHAGPQPGARLEATGILLPLLRDAAAQRLTPLRFAQLWRARRRDPAWRANVMRKLDLADRPWLQALFAGAIHDRTGDPSAQRRLNQALARLSEADIAPPGGRAPAPVAPAKMLLAGE